MWKTQMGSLRCLLGCDQSCAGAKEAGAGAELAQGFRGPSPLGEWNTRIMWDACQMRGPWTPGLPGVQPGACVFNFLRFTFLHSTTAPLDRVRVFANWWSSGSI